MENLTKTMLLTSSIKIDTKEVITKLEKNALESINTQILKDDWQKFKKNQITKRWIVFGILVILMIITDIILWKDYLAPDQVMPQLNKILIIIFIPTIIFGLIHLLIYAMFLERSPKELKAFEEINLAFKKKAQTLITETQTKIYGEILRSIFPEQKIGFEEDLKYKIEFYSQEREISDRNYLSEFIENDLPSYFESFFKYKWELIFPEEIILERILWILPPKSLIEHPSNKEYIRIKEIFLNKDNFFCILLEGSLLDSQFAGFDQEKVFSKEYVKIWKG